ncbi:urease accessory protein UreD [Oceanibaculum indicum]|uniref:Urease accessory protein UreD n=1 Tax=Oceanibaculum indicum TaxID=526216 RepID=A0A420WA89_9PROT|nr:urease accessory protein UreD [Oceanibaculum indicum]RKQ67885.1 urease accessory protein [Oceanibaculum indicum]
MFDVISRSDPGGLPPLQRLRGRMEISAKLVAGHTRLDRLYQEGSAKARLPKTPGTALEAILINTGGGMTGGDRLHVGVAAGAGAHLVATSQAAEKIYRSPQGEALMETRLEVGAGGRLDWLPQETILFQGGRFGRRLEADVAADGALLIVESTIFGRTARGEEVTDGQFADRWRVRRAGRLVFADTTRLDGDIATLLDRPAVAGGGRAVAALLHVTGDAEERLDAVRAVLEHHPAVEGGVSAWNGLLHARLVARTGIALRAALIELLQVLRGQPMPRAWLC